MAAPILEDPLENSPPASRLLAAFLYPLGALFFPPRSSRRTLLGRSGGGAVLPAMSALSTKKGKPVRAAAQAAALLRTVKVKMVKATEVRVDAGVGDADG